jgi:eukaryotic-like serine/threonine-protein kinase
VLFTLATGAGSDRWDKAKIVVQILNSGERKTVIEGGSDARYIATGHLVYALSGSLLAVPFDLAKLEVSGGSVPIVEGVRRAQGFNAGAAHFAFSNTGSLIYIPGPISVSADQNSLGMIEGSGNIKLLGVPFGSPNSFPRVSPDGSRVAFDTADGNAIVWIYELSGTSPARRLTFGGANRYPIWSADGQRVAFQSDREGDLGVFWQRADGTGTAERLTKPDHGITHIPDSWSADGQRISFTQVKGSDATVWILSLQDKKPTPLPDTKSSLLGASVFSPDGRWVAYQIGDPTSSEIYVQPFPPTGAKFQVSKGGGHHPLWSRDGKELFYLPGPGQFVSVRIATQPTFTFSNPRHIADGVLKENGPTFVRQYDALPDGKRFIGVVPSEPIQNAGSSPQQIDVVLNWFEEIKRRVPIK